MSQEKFELKDILGNLKPRILEGSFVFTTSNDELVHLMKTGGESGAAIVPEKPVQSLLWKQISSDKMPDGPKKLTPSQKQIIREWIRQGARTLRPEPEDPASIRFTEEELNHWAFKPVKKYSVPIPAGYEIRTPIDGFIANRLSELGIGFHLKPAERA